MGVNYDDNSKFGLYYVRSKSLATKMTQK
jgi:hypothetical protein